MIVAAALLAMAQVMPPAVPAPPPPSSLSPPTDWSTLSDLHYLRPWQAPPELSRFVADEIAAGRCGAATRTGTGDSMLTAQLIVRVDARGAVHQIVPRAIGCPTVEQYASGLVSRFARGNVAATAGWFRTAIVFTWRG